MIFNPIVPKMEPTTYIGSLAVGSSVWCNVNGTRTEFLIVNKGIPGNSSLYDASCDGVWCLMNSVNTLKTWGDQNNYASSNTQAYLSVEFLGLLETNVQNAILQVKIPYRSGGTGDYETGENGLPCKAFLLSGYEFGFSTSDDSSFPIDGSKLEYFTSGTGVEAKNKRTVAGIPAGSTYGQWTRSCLAAMDNVQSFTITSSGGYNYEKTTSRQYVRPAFILPFDTKIDKDNNIIAPTPSEPQEFKYYWNESPNLTEAYIEIE